MKGLVLVLTKVGECNIKSLMTDYDKLKFCATSNNVLPFSMILHNSLLLETSNFK